MSAIDVIENESILSNAANFVMNGIKAKDALHLACALETNCEYFLTTDDLIQKKVSNNDKIKVLNPIEFIKIIEEL